MARKAQLVAEAVTVVCPFCGEPQPGVNGSEYWTHEDFAKLSGRRKCSSCDEEITVVTDSKVQFR